MADEPLTPAEIDALNAKFRAYHGAWDSAIAMENKWLKQRIADERSLHLDRLAAYEQEAALIKQKEEALRKAGLMEDSALQMMEEHFQKRGLMEASALHMMEEHFQKRGLMEEAALQMMEEHFQKRGLMEEAALQMMENDFQKRGLMEGTAQKMMEDDFRKRGLMESNARQMMEDDFRKRGLMETNAYAMDKKLLEDREREIQLAHGSAIEHEKKLAKQQEDNMRDEAKRMDEAHDRRMAFIQQQQAQEENNGREQARIEASAWKKVGKLASQQLGEEFPVFGNILQRSGNVFAESGTILSKAASISLIAANTLYRASLGISESLGINLGAGFERAFGREFNQLKTLFSTGPLITGAQQANTAQGFSEKFGSILTVPLEKVLTQTARQLNLTGTEFLSGIRGFMPLVGSFDKAQALFTNAVKTFNKEGLTSREAAQFVAEKQELVARYSGTAANELLKAAAAARSAGFSLEKLQGFSDSIVTDFSSFLENAAELSALGINLPIDELGQAALTGGAPAVMEVLNRTLGDITNLTQAQQVVLARSVGIPLNELLAISKKDELKDSVKEKSDMEALKAPTQTAMLMEKFVSVLFPAAHTLLAAIAFSTAKTALGGSGDASALLKAGKWGGGVLGGVGTGTSLGMAQGADSTGSIITSLAGAIVGGLIGGPGGAFIGSSLAGGAYGLLSKKKGDDVSSLPGYGDRTLQTQSGAISLNNRDTVIAYANDMKASSSGIQLLSEGALAPKKAVEPNVVVNVDINRLEDKLEQLQDTMKNMKTSADVYLDGRKVGTSLRSTLGVTDNLATTKTFSY